MREPTVQAISLLGAVAVTLAIAQGIAAQPYPWKEKAELSIAGQTLAPTTAARLHNAEVQLVGAPAMTPVGDDFELDVNAWNLDLCVGEPFRGQPKIVGSAGGLNVADCGGTLIAPDKILTAGHCVKPDGGVLFGQASYDCGGAEPWVGPPLYYFVFDWADQLDPISGPGTVTLDGDTVFECDQVLIDTHNTTFTGDFPPEDGSDYAIIQLTESVPTSRLPMITERTQRTKVGDAVAVLGHPNGLPFKGEVATMTDNAGTVSAHILGGSSGSGVASLTTGKISQIVTGQLGDPWIHDPDPENPPDCLIMDWALPGVGAGGPLAHNWNDSIDPLGLQVVPQDGDNLVFYGPPGSPADFPDRTIDVSVPIGGLPDGVSELEWMTPFSGLFEIVQGPNGGQFNAGESVSIAVAPTFSAVSSPGLVESEIPFFDFVYETREPVAAQAYVGIEGFTLWPDAPFDGEGGLGLADGDLRSYDPRNRWIVWQDVTVSASDDWITVNGFGGQSSPQTYAIRPINSKAPDVAVEVAVDAGNLSPDTPGTYVGAVTFSSDDSGTPAFERSNEVVFDYCRQIFPASGLPWEATIAPGQTETKEFVVSTYPPGATVADVDIVIEDDVVTGGPSFGSRYEIVLEAPNGQLVLLKDYGVKQLTYYDQDRVTPLIELNFLEGGPAPGPWKLHFTNDPNGTEDIEVTLNRWDVRLHTNEATTCEQ